MLDRPDKCDVLVLIPKRDELRSAATVFDLDPETPESKLDDEYEYWSAIVAGLRVQVVLADTQGNANVALVTSSALSAFDPAVAFCVGTAAGREGDISYMDVVLATSVLDATEWRTKDGKLQPQWESKLDPTADVKHDIDLFVKTALWREEAARRFVAALGQLGLETNTEAVSKWPVVQDAWTVTTGFLHQDRGFLDDIWSLNARLRAIDMETAGFVNACMGPARQRPWIVVRAVSDYGTKESKHDGARPAAGAAAAVIAHTFIEHGLRRAHPVRLDPPQSPDPVLSDGNFFARLTMPNFLTEEIPKRFGIPFEEGAVSRELTVNDLAALCGSGDKVMDVLDELRETYFTTKYSDYDDEADVRHLTGSIWAKEVMDIYDYLGITLRQADIIYVGVGNGRDLPLVCPKFNSLAGVDLSAKMLEQAAGTQPELNRVRDRAETLSLIADESADLYLSLRTYQSSLFDVPSALRQAFRVLRSGGGLVLSIPGGFLDRSAHELRYVPGLLVPGSSNVVDRSRPRRYAQQILTQIERMPFSQLGFHQREGDIYVYGRKA